MTDDTIEFRKDEIEFLHSEAGTQRCNCGHLFIFHDGDLDRCRLCECDFYQKGSDGN